MDFLFFCIFSSIYKTSSFNIKHFVFLCVNDVAISMQLIFSSIKDKSFFIHVLSLKSWQDRVRNPKSVKVKRWNSVIPVHVNINPILHRGQKISYTSLYVLYLVQFYSFTEDKDKTITLAYDGISSFWFLRLARALEEHQEDSPRQGQVREIKKASTARKEGEKKGSS